MVLTDFSFKKGLVFSLAVLSLSSAYTLFYSFRVLPNTYFGDINLSHKNFWQSEQLISSKIDAFEKQPVTLVVDNDSLQADWRSLGVSFDREAVSGQIKNNSKSIYRKMLALFDKQKIMPVYSLDFDKFSWQLETLLKNHQIKASEATIVFSGNKFLIQEEKIGDEVDRSKLALDLRGRIENLSSEPLVASKVKSQPRINVSQSQRALEKVNQLSRKKIILTFFQDQWEMSGRKLIDLLRFYPQGQDEGYLAAVQLSGSTTVINSITLVDSSQWQLDVRVDSQKLGDFIEEIAKAIDTQTVDASIKFEGGEVVSFTPARDGQKLDKPKTKQLILDKTSIADISNEGNIIIKLPVSVTAAKVASDEINSLGIRELVGRGISYFAGSIPNRIHNLTLGTNRVSGTLVKPGEIFSFNSKVGEVSAATGYKQAYVISEGRTVLDDGGGICQVSTTIFRAALNAGLPIVARTAHAYRVGYYEQRGFKPGFDATVWAPSVDFQFKNDTQNYLLVQAIVDTANAKLQVDIYGTADDRRVEINEPVISNQKPPLPDKYQDDPTLPKGTRKQVDFAAPGATVVISRKVYKGQQLVIDDTFKSNFRPWQAVYLVGTGG